MQPHQAPHYVKAVMSITWRSNFTRRQHVRVVDLGHVRADQTDFASLAYLNVGGKGEVISYEVTKEA